MRVTLPDREVQTEASCRRCQGCGQPADLSRLRTLFNLCIKWKKYEGENPARRFQLAPESRGRVRFLTEEEEQKLLKETGEPLRSMIVVGIHTGLRVQPEGLTLLWPAIDFNQQTVTVEDHFAKNGETRTLPLNSIALATFKQLKRSVPGPSVFMINKGSKRRNEKHWEPYRSFRTAFESACLRANLRDVTPPVLRHTFASRLVMKGADLRTVQELGGWKNLSMVQRSAHLSQKHKREAVELLAKNSTTLSTTATSEPERRNIRKVKLVKRWAVSSVGRASAF